MNKSIGPVKGMEADTPRLMAPREGKPLAEVLGGVEEGARHPDRSMFVRLRDPNEGEVGKQEKTGWVPEDIQEEFQDAMGGRTATKGRLDNSYTLRDFVRSDRERAVKMAEDFQALHGRPHSELLKAIDQVKELDEHPIEVPPEDPEYNDLAYSFQEDPEYQAIKQEVDNSIGKKVFGEANPGKRAEVISKMRLDEYMAKSNQAYDLRAKEGNDRVLEQKFKQRSLEQGSDRYTKYLKREQTRVYRDPDGMINPRLDPAFPRGEMVPLTRNRALQAFARNYPEKAQAYADQVDGLREVVDVMDRDKPGWEQTGGKQDVEGELEGEGEKPGASEDDKRAEQMKKAVALIDLLNAQVPVDPDHPDGAKRYKHDVNEVLGVKLFDLDEAQLRKNHLELVKMIQMPVLNNKDADIDLVKAGTAAVQRLNEAYNRSNRAMGEGILRKRQEVLDKVMGLVRISDADLAKMSAGELAVIDPKYLEAQGMQNSSMLELAKSKHARAVELGAGRGLSLEAGGNSGGAIEGGEAELGLAEVEEADEGVITGEIGADQVKQMVLQLLGDQERMEALEEITGRDPKGMVEDLLSSVENEESESIKHKLAMAMLIFLLVSAVVAGLVASAAEKAVQG